MQLKLKKKKVEQKLLKCWYFRSHFLNANLNRINNQFRRLVLQITQISNYPLFLLIRFSISSHPLRTLFTIQNTQLSAERNIERLIIY